MSKSMSGIKQYLGKLGLAGVGTVIVSIATGVTLGILPYTDYTISQSLARGLFWLSIVAGAFGVGLITVAVIKHKQKESKEKPQIKKQGLTATLTAMHRRLTELQKEKASHTEVSYMKWKKVTPTLAARMGVVELRDWHKYVRNAKSRLLRAMPRKRFKRLSRLSNPKRWFVEHKKWEDEAHLAILSVALQLKDELVKSEDWTLDDGIKASKWLDGYDWGVAKLRDGDPQWQGLFNSISNYLIDAALRNLIQKHIDVSYMCSNVNLLTNYSRKFKDDVFSIMLHEALVGSPISPEKAEIALSEILSDINNRLIEIKK